MPGEEASYAEMLGDAELMFQCISKYKDHRKAVNSGAVSRNSKFSIAEIAAVLKKTQGVDVLHKGTLMCKRRFCTLASDRL